MSSCIVHLDNYTGSYYSGGTIIGKIVCTFSESRNIRGIMVKFRGHEYSMLRNHHHASASRYGERTFITIDSTLMGIGGEHEAGQHEYRFKLDIPKNIPGNFEAKYGAIRYYITGIVDDPANSYGATDIPLSIVSPIDLNEMANLQLSPTQYQKSEVPYSLCCASGAIMMNVSLEKKAFVLDEVVPVQIELCNQSNSDVARVEIDLLLTTISKAYIHSTYQVELLTSTSVGGVSAHDEKIYKVDMKIPNAALIVNFTMSTLFEQKYTMKVTAIVLGWHTNLTSKIDVKLGHIALRDRGGTQRVPSQQHPAEDINTSDVNELSPLLPSSSHQILQKRESSAVASAPPKDSLPSASKKAGFTIVEPPPPSYREALEASSTSNLPQQK